MSGGLFKPLRRRQFVLGYAFSRVVTGTETVLSDGMTLFRRFRIPLYGFLIVFFRYAFTEEVTIAETALRKYVALLFCQSKEFKRLKGVFFYSLTVVIANTEIVLSFGIALICRQGVPLNGFDIVFSSPFSPPS